MLSKCRREKWSLLIRVRMQNRFAHWRGWLLQTGNRKEFKVIQGNAECGWSLMNQWARTGGEMCPLSKSGHELGACTHSLRNPQPAHAEDFTGKLSCLFQSTIWKFLLLFLQQPVVQLRLESRAMAAAWEPHFVELHLPLQHWKISPHFYNHFHQYYTSSITFYFKGKRLGIKHTKII